MKDLAHFQFVSLTTCERTQTARGLQEKPKMATIQEFGKSPDKERPRREPGSPNGKVVTTAAELYGPSPEDKLWQWPKQGPMAFSSKSEDGGIWSTTGKVALHGKSCKLSTQPALMSDPDTQKYLQSWLGGRRSKFGSSQNHHWLRRPAQRGQQETASP